MQSPRCPWGGKVLADEPEKLWKVFQKQTLSDKHTLNIYSESSAPAHWLTNSICILFLFDFVCFWTYFWFVCLHNLTRLFNRTIVSLWNGETIQNAANGGFMCGFKRRKRKRSAPPKAVDWEWGLKALIKMNEVCSSARPRRYIMRQLHYCSDPAVLTAPSAEWACAWKGEPKWLKGIVEPKCQPVTALIG